MTIQEVHRLVKFKLDKNDSLNYPNFLPEEIDLVLNEAQDRYVKLNYGNNNPKQESYEETQKRTEDLKNLTVNSVLTPVPNNNENIDVNAVFFDLPADHLFIVQERCKIAYKDCHNKTIESLVRPVPIKHATFTRVIDNEFTKPNKEKVLRLMALGKIEIVYSPDTNVVEYRLRYLKQPRRVSIVNNITFELSEHTQLEIIDLAVMLLLEGIEGKRLNSFIETNYKNKE